MNLIEKYNVSVPRYTSYPPANYFVEMSAESYQEAVCKSNDEGCSTLSFYLHIPFCHHLCHYCGCNSYAQPSDKAVVDKYISALHKEIDMVAALIAPQRKISQIHYGGGTPTLMPVEVLREINEHILSLFGTIEKPEIAIECHPGFLNAEQWQSLTQSHFNRFSIGVQDFDEKVLKVVNRTPALIPVEEIVPILRSTGATISMDFLYGLPLQTPQLFAQSIERAIATKPDRVVTFGYGHVPWVFKRQAILEQYGLPLATDKQQMYENAANLLCEAGYVQIGMDHFVLPTDELYLALKNGQLHRNFQGYCTRRTTGQVYAFGVTAISQLDGAYCQNTKSIEQYIELIEQGKLPSSKGYTLTAEQRIARSVIEQLMCNYQISWSQIAEELKLSIDEVRKALHFNLEQLQDMQADGILSLTTDTIKMTTEGHPYVRNVAAALDPLMQNTTKQFSKPI